VNIAISAASFLDIPAHACTESEHFGFGMKGSPSHLNCFTKNLSHRTVLSSVNTQSLNSSFCTNISVQEKSRCSLFSARIIWQYRVLVWTQYHLTVPCTRPDPVSSDSTAYSSGPPSIIWQYRVLVWTTQYHLTVPCTRLNHPVSSDSTVYSSGPRPFVVALYWSRWLKRSCVVFPVYAFVVLFH